MCLGLAMLLMAVPAQVFAQSGKYEVKGVVVDTTGTPVIGASVIEQGTTNGVTTDVNGQYVLNVNNAESIVVISFIGYQTQSLVASSSVLSNVVLEEDSEMIDDVVVIGYGSQKKKEVTGSVASVKAEDFNAGVKSSPMGLLQGKVAGVQINTASASGVTSSSSILCNSVSIVISFESVGVSSSDTVIVISLLGFIFSIVFSALPITVSSSFVIVLTSIVPLSDIVIGPV